LLTYLLVLYLISNVCDVTIGSEPVVVNTTHKE